jgi:hypothetical protein
MIGIKQKYQDLFFQTEQTVNRKKSGFRAAPFCIQFELRTNKSVIFGSYFSFYQYLFRGHARIAFRNFETFKKCTGLAQWKFPLLLENILLRKLMKGSCVSKLKTKHFMKRFDFSQFFEIMWLA